MRQIIVDGYNVIRADPRLQSFERVSLEHARDVLVRTLASAPRLSRDQVTVVFDGTYGTRGHVHSHRLGRIEMLYSARGQTADQVIVAQARSLAARGQVVVVSNDVEVREHCRAEGAQVSGSENLLSQLPGALTPPHDDRRGGPEWPPASPTLSTEKRGNPRRTSKKDRKRRDVRF